MSKVNYLIRSISRRPDPARHACPNCGTTDAALVERKYVITDLRRCAACKLMYRTPTDDPAEAEVFYNKEYAQGFTTDTPALGDLAEMKANNFAGTVKDYSYYIDVVRQFGAPKNARLFDFGCSWGYGSYQFAQAGFDTLSYEISVPRRSYAAENLGVRLVEDFEAWARSPAALHSQDVFFSAHVLEHVPSPTRIIALAKRILRPGGLFLSFFPNGSAPFRAASPNWSKLWGEDHPNFLDDVYLDAAFDGVARVYGTSPAVVDDAARAALAGDGQGAHLIDPLARYELLCAARF